MSELGTRNNSLPLRVVKVGCSLIERPQLDEQLRCWLQGQPAAIHLLVAGAGAFTETIKIWDARFNLGDAESHWLAIRAMSITSRVLARLVVGSQFISAWADLISWIAAVRPGDQPAVAVVDLWEFLAEIEPAAPPEPLPHTWQVTTDSLAARLAEVLQADELVVLKARPLPCEEQDYSALIAEGYVDDYFLVIARRLPKITFARLAITP